MKRKNKKWIIPALLAGAIILGTYVVNSVSKEPSVVSTAFLEARSNGSLIAEEIVKLSERSLENIRQISEEDQKGRIPSALVLVSEEIDRNDVAREKAVELAKELEIMTQNLPDIQPERARQLATQAIGYELSIISHLITYNDHITDLLTALQKKLEGDESRSAAVNAAIEEMNSTALTINELNGKYQQTMHKFDSYFAK